MRAERRLNTTKSNSQSDKNLLRLLSGCYQGYSSEAFRGLPGKVLGMKLTRRCNGDRKVKKSDTYLLHFERLRWELLKVNVKYLDIYNLLGKLLVSQMLRPGGLFLEIKHFPAFLSTCPKLSRASGPNICRTPELETHHCFRKTIIATIFTITNELTLLYF